MGYGALKSGIFLIGTCLAASALAQTSADIDTSTRQSETILRQQQERLQQDLRDARRELPPQEGANLERYLPPASGNATDATCHPVAEIRVIGANRLDAEQVRAVTAPFVGQCLGVAGIEALLGALTRQYLERGYVTTRVYLPAQNLKTGTLLLQVLEGSIERYRIEGDEAGIRLPNAFPRAPGELLHLRDLEQGIEQINRLGSNSARMDIEPGSEPGASVVVVRNQAQRPAHLLVSADNQGSESTGTHNALLSLTLDSPLGWNERLVASRRESFTPERSGHRSENDALELWLPLGYSAVTASYSKSSYLNIFATASGSRLRSEGETETTSLGLDRVVYRDQTRRASTAARLTRTATDNFLERQRLTVSSRTLAYADLSASGSQVLRDGTLSGQLAYAQGLDALDAQKDAADLAEEAPRAQFRRVSADLAISQSLRLGGRDFSWSSQFNGQYGLTTLYGAQQMLIGSLGSVRGFTTQSLSGDHGYYVRNELATPVRLGSGSTALAARLYVGYDFGAVRNRAPGATDGFLSGMALGVSLRWRGLSADLSATQALAQPSTMTREPASVWLRLAYSI